MACRHHHKCIIQAIISFPLVIFCRWLGKQAEALGVEIYRDFQLLLFLYNEDGSVRGVATGDMGIGKDGEKTGGYMPGMDLLAKQTVFAEECPRTSDKSPV